MMLLRILFESGYFSVNPLRPKVLENLCQDATISISAVNGDCPCFSRFSAASRIFSGTVKSSTFGFVEVATRIPQSSKGLPEMDSNLLWFRSPTRLKQLA